MRAVFFLGYLAFAGEARRVHKSEDRPESSTGRAKIAMQALSSALAASRDAAAFMPPAPLSLRSARPLRTSLDRFSMKEKTASKRDKQKRNKEFEADRADRQAERIETGYESKLSSVREETVEDLIKPTPKKPAKPLPWNPRMLNAPKVADNYKVYPGTELFEQQFVAKYMKESPPYLTGELEGDAAFDPWCLVALAKPNMDMDKTLRTAEAREKKMLAMSAEEQAECVAWMRDSELKHGRLAMLAAAGWPIAELANRGSTALAATNGRAPSLFNGHLLDYLPFLLVFFGGLSFLESSTKDTIKNGDYGFDPLGISDYDSPLAKAIPKEVPVLDIFEVMVGELEELKLAEIKNGRAAMMAITGFAVQEFFYGTPVVQQTSFFFR